MSTFEDIEQFIVPEELGDETDRLLREAGRAQQERFVLLSGVVEKQVFVARTLHLPKQRALRSAEGLSVHVDGPELHRLNVWLFENGEQLAIQIHSHPTEAFHSDTDDAYPMVTTRGGLSLVVPDFCARGVRGPGTALFRLDEHGWYEIAQPTAGGLLAFVR